MACRITELALDCRDPDRLARFWAAVLGYEVIDRDDDGTCVQIGRPDAPFTLLFLSSDDHKRDKLRLHIDVNATDRTQEEELARLLDLGATHLDIGQGEQSWYVLADPEGHEFCLLRSTVQP